MKFMKFVLLAFVAIVRSASAQLDLDPVPTPVAVLASNAMQRILSTGVVQYDDVQYYSRIDDKVAMGAILAYVESPTNSIQVSAKLYLSSRTGTAVTPNDVLLGMAWAESQASFRTRRTALNGLLLALAVREARQNGQPTVGVVIPKYKAVVDAENSGVNFVESLLELGVSFPLDWEAEKTVVEGNIAALYSGESMAPSGNELARIELYKGVVGLNEFVRRYNEL